MSLLLALALAVAPPPFLRIRAVGDVMLGTSIPEGHLPPDGGVGLLAEVAPLLKDADLTFMNLEGPLCDNGTTTKCKRSGSCYAFRTPTSHAPLLMEAGLDLASTANNHSGDFGELCRRETEATLDKLGVTWSGPPGSIGLREVNGKKVALVAFHTSAACNDVNQLSAAKALVTKAVSQADLVVVSFHGGAEGTKATRVQPGAEHYLGENRGDLRAFTHAVIDAGADLVLGHGPHVLRGAELYRGRLIAYSLGNFATYGRFDLSGPLGISVILEVSLAEDGAFAGGKLIATKQVGRGVPKLDPAGVGIRTVRELSRQDFGESAVEVDSDGTLKLP